MSAFLHLIRQCHEDHKWLWAENCSGQNKNWYLFTSLAQCANKWGPETITIKYLEKGHTFMAADAIHAKQALLPLLMTSSNCVKRETTT